MKWKKEFITHLEFNTGQLVSNILNKWQGSPFEDEEPKVIHPIENVNRIYSKGWCTEGFDEVVTDLNDYFVLNLVVSTGYFGTAFVYGKHYSPIPFGTLITREEYLELTGRKKVEIKVEPAPQKEEKLITIKLKDNDSIDFESIGFNGFEVIGILESSLKRIIDAGNK